MSVELVDFMGSDDHIVDCARVSFSKQAANYTTEQNHKLLDYLAKHGHWSPFAHSFLSFRIKIPMFLAMQIDKHTVGLVTNSVSRRYVDEEPEFFFPKDWRGRPVNAKQGSSDVIINRFVNEAGYEVHTTGHAEYVTGACTHVYNSFIKAGICPEQARMMLPMNTMIERIWSGSLYAFARVCKLRLDGHAQKEATDFASMLNKAIPSSFNISWKALLDG